MEWWRQAGRFKKGLVIALAVFIGIIAVSAIAGDPPADDTAAIEPPPPPPDPAPEPEPPPPAEPPDTGRMSEGEYDSFSQQLEEIENEVDQFADGMSKCGVLLSARDFAEASDCVDEAYDGVEGNMLLAYETSKDMDDQVAKGCRKALRTYKTRLDSYFGYLGALSKAGSDLQFERFTTLAKLAGPQARRYQQGRVWVLRDCEPR